MKRNILILLFLVLAAGRLAAQTPDPNFFIFLGFGQSNMQGKAAIESEDKDSYSTKWGKANWARFKKLIVVDNKAEKIGTWAAAKPPIVRPDTGLGPTDYFGRYLVENLDTCYKVGVVVVAVDGASIRAFDKNKTNAKLYINGADSWVKDAAAYYDNYPYGKLVEMAKIAQQSGVIKGIIFHQGETDVTGTSESGAKDWYKKVTKIYTNLLADLDLSAEDVPFIAGEPLRTEEGGVCGDAVQWVDKLPAYLNEAVGTECAYVASSDGLTNTDQYHFSSAGYRELGRRYGAIMLPLLKKSIAGVQPNYVTSDFENVYDLSGRIVDAHTPGLKIVGGKKILLE